MTLLARLSALAGRKDREGTYVQQIAVLKTDTPLKLPPIKPLVGKKRGHSVILYRRVS